MFQHATAMDQKEYDHTIYQGWREPSPERDLSVDLTAMDLIHPDSQCQDFDDLYWEVYQLHRLPGWGRCEEATEEQLCHEVLELIKEGLRLKQPPAQPEREWLQLSADTTQLGPHMPFAAANHRNYEEFIDASHRTYAEMLALTNDANQWAFVVAVILEEWTEGMSHSTSHHFCSSCWCSSSCQHRRSRSSGHWEGDPQVTSCHREPKARSEGPQADSHQGGKIDIDMFATQKTLWVASCQRSATQGWAQSPSPTRQKCQVIFTEGRAPSLTEESPKHNARVPVGSP